MNDWMDVAWDYFSAANDLGKWDDEHIRMLKEAWLDGARTGVDRAQRVVREAARDLQEAR
jgi:hypothetical protein